MAAPVSTATKENVEKLVTERIVTRTSADAFLRLLAGESVDAVIASRRIAKPVASAAGDKRARVFVGEPSKTTLFVANLPFSTTDEQLKKLFEAHKPKEARIAIRRDGRSRGYGFVTFENETDMKAGLQLDKSTFDSREISVRVVIVDKKPEAAPQQRSQPFSRLPPRPRIPRTAQAVSSSSSSPSSAAAVAPKEPSKTVTFIGNLPYSIDDAKLADVLKGYKLASPPKVSRRPDGYSLGFALVTFENEAEQTRAISALNNTQLEGRQIKVEQSQRSATRPGRSGPRREPRAPRSQPATGEVSKTTLFVANLPYIVDDAGLLQIFEGFQVKEAHVPRRRNGMSTGYGFVTLAKEEDTDRALKEVDKSLVEKREISVRPAYNRTLPAAAAAAAVVTPAAPAAK